MPPLRTVVRRPAARRPLLLRPVPGSRRATSQQGQGPRGRQVPEEGSGRPFCLSDVLAAIQTDQSDRAAPDLLLASLSPGCAGPLDERGRSMKPTIADLDRTAITNAIAAGFETLPLEDKERLAVLADIQGGFPYDWQWGEDALRVVWADITIAVVPYELVRRRELSHREN